MRLLRIEKSVVMKLLQIFSHYSLYFLSKTFEHLFDTAWGQDSLVCDDVGWWSGFKTFSDGVDDVSIGIGEIMGGTGTNNKVTPYHGAAFISFIVLVDSVGIPWVI